MRRWWLVLIVFAIVGGGSFFAGANMVKPQYEGRAKVSYVDNNPNPNGSGIGSNTIHRAILLMNSRYIPLLAARFLQEAAVEAGRAADVGRPAPGLSPAALAALERSDWPGNARELQNCLRQALALYERLVQQEGRRELLGDLACVRAFRAHSLLKL